MATWQCVSTQSLQWLRAAVCCTASRLDTASGLHE
jgi:hypothetical protein